MASYLLYFLILFPLSVALIIVLVRKEALFPVIIYPASAVLIAASCLLIGLSAGGKPMLIPAHFSWVEQAMLVIEGAMSAYLLFLAIKQRDWFVSFLVVVQAALLFWFHFNFGHSAHAEANLFIDLFSVVMGLIVGVVGTLIAVFSVGYMRDMHHHVADHAAPVVPDNRPVFFGIIFLFLSAMFGVCFSNNLFWLFFFWEITTVCSFLMIRYKRDTVSVKNAFWALRWNLLGGLAFLLGIIFLFHTQHTIELDKLLALPKALVMLPIALISFAGLTKSAQLPFSSWLVGAMVAPTPVSALLHSSTMVKAGVYIVLRFATSLEGTLLGMLIALVGLVTFLIGSFICISQNDAKKVLAYSTIANLGLIILCAGIGTYEAVWAGILLIVFHAVSKGLLFLCVGSIEHKLGSRQIEDMSGLIVRLPKLAFMLEIGIAGMFLAPFGMLISKWAVLRAIVDSNPLFAIFLIYGSAATLFFWVKWLGKIINVEKVYTNIETGICRGQWLAMGSLAVLTLAICALFAPFAAIFIEPYIIALYGHSMSLGAGNMAVMTIMLSMMAFFPLAFLDRGRGVKVAPPYLAGANVGELGQQFRDSLGGVKAMHMKNFYMEAYFSEARLMRLGVLLTVVFLLVIIAVGGLQ
ncbi:MAG: NADH-quinone oxidoreductase subunit L [Candidatus Omnitrophica bacterium]|nr:NADH-quinone oxidoreductase subunit L [Candidatus Omnitrophota bacterium]